ncbi:MAG: hypothetical protein Ct9H300mP19_13790 [Dehalococcoidia bacterium]|nr:MAG: hypothetical protein Ct9H300mP19_13790 [Dehalococcoidia bacterium]
MNSQHSRRQGQLSARYISDRLLPDKAVDLIDEAAAKKRIENEMLPTELNDMQLELQKLDEEEESASALRRLRKGSECQSRKITFFGKLRSCKTRVGRDS